MKVYNVGSMRSPYEAQGRGHRIRLGGMVRIGTHFHVDNPLTAATDYGAAAAQFFLGDPQGWKGPVRPGGDPAAIRAPFAAAERDIYIRAPYVITVATSNNGIRIPSRKLLDQQLKAAASVGA